MDQYYLCHMIIAFAENIGKHNTSLAKKRELVSQIRGKLNQLQWCHVTPAF